MPTSGLPENNFANECFETEICTGAQFPSRFVRAAEVPGNGLCYFYDDGSFCKAMVGGEAVNAY